MTLHDFNGPLQTKLHGTRNLSRTFQSDALDFFVSLSSATATVGTRGQANYTAGTKMLLLMATLHQRRITCQ